MLPSCLSDNLEFYTQPVFFHQILKTFLNFFYPVELLEAFLILSLLCDLFFPFFSDNLLAVIVYSVLRFHNDIPLCGSVLRPGYLLGPFSRTAHILQLWEFFLNYITEFVPSPVRFLDFLNQSCNFLFSPLYCFPSSCSTSQEIFLPITILWSFSSQLPCL